jgi:hypothetical protein
MVDSFDGDDIVQTDPADCATLLNLPLLDSTKIVCLVPYHAALSPAFIVMGSVQYRLRGGCLSSLGRRRSNWVGGSRSAYSQTKENG